MQPQAVFHPSVSSALDQLRDEFPFLAGAAADKMFCGERHRRTIDARTRALAMLAAFAATGDRAQLKICAAHALDAGLAQDELKEIAYLTAVHTGFARAIDAAQALSELFAERWEKGEPIN